MQRHLASNDVKLVSRNRGVHSNALHFVELAHVSRHVLKLPEERRVMGYQHVQPLLLNNPKISKVARSDDSDVVDWDQDYVREISAGSISTFKVENGIHSTETPGPDVLKVLVISKCHQ